MIKIIDLSVTINDSLHNVKIQKWSHKAGASILSKRARNLPGYSKTRILWNYVLWLLKKRVVKPEDLSNGEFLSNEFYEMSVHTGTHVDAPFHYGSDVEGSPAKKITDLPLEWLFGPAVVLDGTRSGPVISEHDLEQELDELGYDSLEGIIVLVRTGCDQKWGTSSYYSDGIAIAPSAIQMLLDLGAKVIGTDAWSIDRPASHMLEDYFRTHDGEYLWPSHMLGRQKEFIVIECLANLDKLPRTGFSVCAFPIALCAGASWTRAVAFLE